MSRASLASGASVRDASARAVAASAALPSAKRISPVSRLAKPRATSSVSRGIAAPTSSRACSAWPARSSASARATSRSARAAVAGCQLGGAAQQGRRGRVAAAGARAFGGVLELGGEFLVGDYRGRGPVPGALVEVGLGAGRFAEGGVRAPPITIGRAVIYGGSQERMAEPDRVTGELKDAVCVRRGRVRVDSGLRRRPPQQAALTRDVGRGQQHEGLRVGRKIAYLAQEAIPEPLAHRKRLGQRCAAGELLGRVLGAELHQRERVIVRCRPGCGRRPGRRADRR